MNLNVRTAALLISIVLLFVSQSTFALASSGRGGGDGTGNGGDICENRFKTVRDDIKTWIDNGGSVELTLPKSISHAEYVSAMSASILSAQASCTDRKIMIGKSEKTCKNFIDFNGRPRIECNNARFLSTSESDQYVLVHHEYAGLSGLEVNVGESSTYLISNQLTGYLADTVVKKLVVAPSHSSSAQTYEVIGSEDRFTGRYLIFSNNQGRARILCDFAAGFSRETEMFFDFYPADAKPFRMKMRFSSKAASSGACSNLFMYLSNATKNRPAYIIIDFQAALNDPTKVMTIK